MLIRLWADLYFESPCEREAKVNHTSPLEPLCCVHAVPSFHLFLSSTGVSWSCFTASTGQQRTTTPPCPPRPLWSIWTAESAATRWLAPPRPPPTPPTTSAAPRPPSTQAPPSKVTAWAWMFSTWSDRRTTVTMKQQRISSTAWLRRWHQFKKKTLLPARLSDCCQWFSLPLLQMVQPAAPTLGTWKLHNVNLKNTTVGLRDPTTIYENIKRFGLKDTSWPIPPAETRRHPLPTGDGLYLLAFVCRQSTIDFKGLLDLLLIESGPWTTSVRLIRAIVSADNNHSGCVECQLKLNALKK